MTIVVTGSFENMSRQDIAELIENARVLPDGETLEFKAKEFSPFAIVVDTGADKVPDAEIPNTDVQNTQMPMQLMIGAAAVLASATIIAIVFKNKNCFSLLFSKSTPSA